MIFGGGPAAGSGARVHVHAAELWHSELWATEIETRHAAFLDRRMRRETPRPAVQNVDRHGPKQLPAKFALQSVSKGAYLAADPTRGWYYSRIPSPKTTLVAESGPMESVRLKNPETGLYITVTDGSASAPARTSPTSCA